MSKRLNYGPRFGGNRIVDASFKYDRALDVQVPFTMRTEAGSTKAALRIAKACSATKAAKRCVGKLPIGDPPKAPEKTRADYENAMIKRVNDAIALMEFGLDELNEAPPGPSLVSRAFVMDAIDKLRKAARHGGVTNHQRWESRSKLSEEG
jgi:hypothetical protein